MVSTDFVSKVDVMGHFDLKTFIDSFYFKCCLWVHVDRLYTTDRIYYWWVKRVGRVRIRSNFHWRWCIKTWFHILSREITINTATGKQVMLCKCYIQYFEEKCLVQYSAEGCFPHGHKCMYLKKGKISSMSSRKIHHHHVYSGLQRFSRRRGFRARPRIWSFLWRGFRGRVFHSLHYFR